MSRSFAALGVTVTLMACSGPTEIPVHDPVIVRSPLRLDGVVVRGAKQGWYLATNGPRYADPVPVVLTSYCLRGTTRRGRYVRPGIIAADPSFFPLSRYVELYVGRKYYGRFLVDDTGRKIRGNRIDVWLPTCRESKVFGVKRGTAVLLPRLPEMRQAGSPASQAGPTAGR